MKGGFLEEVKFKKDVEEFKAWLRTSWSRKKAGLEPLGCREGTGSHTCLEETDTQTNKWRGRLRVGRA